MNDGDRVRTKKGDLGTVRRSVPELIGRPAMAWIEWDNGAAGWMPIAGLTLEPAAQ